MTTQKLILRHKTLEELQKEIGPAFLEGIEEDMRELLARYAQGLGSDYEPKSKAFTIKIKPSTLADIKLAARGHRVSQSDFIEILVGMAKSIGMIPRLEDHPNAK